ncbi:hypothetical protein VCR20J5_1240162 [Vibrio crassostreae]|nr:hypothetical protein VCR20J5_1240162 [Vibrio crassostreae]
MYESAIVYCRYEQAISNVDNLKSYSSKKGHFPCLYIKMKKWPYSKFTKAAL